MSINSLFLNSLYIDVLMELMKEESTPLFPSNLKYETEYLLLSAELLITKKSKIRIKDNRLISTNPYKTFKKAVNAIKIVQIEGTYLFLIG